MVDVLTPEQRRYNMSQIKSKDTKPEITIRRLLHKLGYRYRLHRADLPGKPDMIFPKIKKVIFVHGCYWHMHRCRYGRVVPKTNAKFWQNKRNSNVERDRKNIKKLRKLGWDILVVWQCQIRSINKLQNKLIYFLSQEI